MSPGPQSVIYVPGLGDRYSYGQPSLLFLWRIFGLRVHYFAVGWDKDNFEPSFQKLLDKIDALGADGRSVALMGASAGATAVINAYAVKKNVKAVVLICGKINNPQTVGEVVYRHNPAFKDSIKRVKRSLELLGDEEKARIMSIHPLVDKSVPPADTLISGSREHTLQTKGHVFSIFFALAFKGRLVARFIRSQ